MSIIVVLKEADTLILSTDSRMMAHDYSGVASDTEQKIFEIAPGTFIATSGRKMASEFQVARARELAVELGTTDIQAIGAALERESLPCLMTLVERLRLEPDETTRQAVSGESLLHGCMLVGRTAGGKLGYVFHSYRVQAGVVKCETDAYFEARRKITATSGGSMRLLAEIASRFTQNPATWIDPPEQVSMRFLETVKRSTSTIGGPYQVVRLAARRARWISRPPQAAVPLVGNLTAATITAAVSMTSPTLTVSGSGFTINLDSANGFKMTKSGTGYVAIGGPAASLIEVSDGAGFDAYVYPQGFTTRLIGTPTTNAAYKATGVVLAHAAGWTNLDHTGFTSVNGLTPFTGTLAAAMAAGKSVQGGIIC